MTVDSKKCSRGDRKMYLQERLAQCQTDKKAIEAQEQKLLDQIKKSEQKIPFARFTSNVERGVDHPRLILHVTPDFVRLMNKHNGHVVSLGHFGSGGEIIVCCNSSSDHSPTVDSLVHQYEYVQTLIG